MQGINPRFSGTPSTVFRILPNIAAYVFDFLNYFKIFSKNLLTNYFLSDIIKPR